MEGLAYSRFEWDQTLTQEHVYASATHYVPAFPEFLMVGSAWSVAGTVLGAAFYRRPAVGMAFIPLGLLMVGLVESAAGPSYLGPISAVDPLSLFGRDLANLTPTTTGALAVGVVVAGLGLMWLLVRDLPIRTRSG